MELRPIRASDLDFLYSASTSPETSFRWRFRGQVPDPTEFANSLNKGVLLQLVVEKRASHELIGLVTAYNAHHRDGYAYVAGLSASKFLDTGLVLDGQ